MKKIIFFLILIVFTACRSDSSDYSKNNEKSTANAMPNQNRNYDSNTNVKNIERKTIKMADIRFRVKDLVESTKRIEAIAAQYDGFISGMNQSTSSHSIDNIMTLRVPAESLEKLLAEIERESTYTYHKRISVKNITEEFVDKTSRLNTKKEVRDRYIAVLRDKAGTVQDILNAEEKIRIIQEEIEAIEGRLRYLNDQTALSTVKISMYQKINYNPVTYEKSFSTKIIDGFMDGWKFIQVTIIGLVTIWPILLVALVAFLARKRISRVITGNKES